MMSLPADHPWSQTVQLSEHLLFNVEAGEFVTADGTPTVAEEAASLGLVTEEVILRFISSVFAVEISMAEGLLVSVAQDPAVPRAMAESDWKIGQVTDDMDASYPIRDVQRRLILTGYHLTRMVGCTYKDGPSVPPKVVGAIALLSLDLLGVLGDVTLLLAGPKPPVSPRWAAPTN
jgi:hypothetical protein